MRLPISSVLFIVGLTCLPIVPLHILLVLENGLYFLFLAEVGVLIGKAEHVHVILNVFVCYLEEFLLLIDPVCKFFLALLVRLVSDLRDALFC